jgi:hypothetical protein
MLANIIRNRKKTGIGGGGGGIVIDGGDPYYNYTSLLLHMDGANASTNFVDSGPNALAVTATSSTISTTQSKYGGASGSFNGTSSYLQMGTPNDSRFLFGTGDFTIEFWMYVSAFSGSNIQTPINNYGSTATGWNIQINCVNTNNVRFSYGDTSIALTASNTLVAAQWHHIAVTRSGTSATIWINGTASATTTNSTNISAGAILTIGKGATGANQYFNGYIDDLRITKYARYTSAFTPPAAALPDIYNPNTTLPVTGAALWLDASQQNTLFTDAGFSAVTTSGQSVYQWNDLSGNNRHAIQATSGNRPTWSPPASGQNGLGVTSFNGSSSFFDTSMSLNGLSSFSIFLVAKSATSGGWQSALRQQSGFQGFFVMPWTSNGGAVSPRIILGYDGGTTTPNTVALTNGAFNLISFIRNSGVSNVANVNGVLSSTRSANTASLSESVNLSIGRYPQPVAEYFSGSIAEIVIFNRALSPSETSSVESYLKTKWGTP